MKVFISWSGELSHQVAILLKDWFHSVIQHLEPYLSSEDVDKGARWFVEIAQELEGSSFGVLCLTRSNVNAPWILFEAGALSKSVDRSRVLPFLIDLSPSDLTGPLAQFQATTGNENDIKKMIRTLNRGLNEHRLQDYELDKYFEKWWPDLQNGLQEIMSGAGHSKQDKDLRSDREVLDDILQVSRSIMRAISEASHVNSPSTQHHFPTADDTKLITKAVIDVLRKNQVLQDDEGKL